LPFSVAIKRNDLNGAARNNLERNHVGAVLAIFFQYEKTPSPDLALTTGHIIG
jgi:hypothetical protein